MAIADRPPGSLTRVALRAPTLLYRARLGLLLGNRFLCIVHRYRNLEAAPAIGVDIGRRRWSEPEQRFLDEESIAGMAARIRAVAFRRARR